MRLGTSRLWAGVEEVRTVARMVTNRRGLRRAIARGYVFDLARLVTDEMLVDCGTERFYVATRDKGVGREVFIWRQFDAASFERTFEFVEAQGYSLKDSVFVDIGANIGTTSVMAVTRLGCSDVLAFEPSPSNVRMLRHNILANGLEERITPVCVAVSDSAGRVEMRVCPTNSGDNRIAEPGLSIEDDRRRISVRAVSLDDWLHENDLDVRSIGALWVDAQGHEPYVLAGASRVLAAETPIVCEFWPHGLQEVHALEVMCEVLIASGRRIFDLGPPAQDRAPTLLGSREVRALAERYPGTNNFCDLLLLR